MHKEQLQSIAESAVRADFEGVLWITGQYSQQSLESRLRKIGRTAKCATWRRGLAGKQPDPTDLPPGSWHCLSDFPPPQAVPSIAWKSWWELILPTWCGILNTSDADFSDFWKDEVEMAMMLQCGVVKQGFAGLLGVRWRKALLPRRCFYWKQIPIPCTLL